MCTLLLYAPPLIAILLGINNDLGLIYATTFEYFLPWSNVPLATYYSVPSVRVDGFTANYCSDLYHFQPHISQMRSALILTQLNITDDQGTPISSVRGT